MTRVIALVGIGLVFAGGIFSFVWFQSNRPLSPAGADHLLQVAIANADSGHLDLAREQLLRILADIPSHHRARETLATMYVNLRLPREAATALSALPDEYLAENFYDSLSLAEFMMKFGFLFDAEPFLRRLHAISPQQRVIRKELLKCLRICGDNNRAAPLLASSLNDHSEKVELADLLMATAPRRFWGTDADRKFMKRVGQRSDDPYTLLGYARWEEDQGHLAVSQEILRRVLFVQPEWQSAAIRSAIISWQLGLEEEWRKNMQDWDPATLDDADAWFILGVWQQQHNDARSAIRCFGEALQRAPKHSGACWQLIATLREIGLESEAARWKSYAERLSQLETYCVDFSSFKARPEKVERLAEECELIGWHHEAAAWYRYGREQWPDLEWPKTPDEAAESAASTSNQDIFDPLDELTATLDFRQFPLPGRLDRDAISKPRSKEAAVEASGWRFENEAAQLGITFRFEQGLPPKRDRAYMFEFAGPGTGILDYDGDGWPDIHLTQGAKWPVVAEDTSLKDELYRNLGNGRFVSVTDSAGLGEPGYSQGSAVGDFDNDGFPDVYVCNIGPNRCYRNNGDGTFSEVTSATGSAGQEWSVSAAWADLNDDGQLDLYVVNYLAGTVFDERCFDKGGRPIQCPPTLFPRGGRPPFSQSW